MFAKSCNPASPFPAARLIVLIVGILLPAPILKAGPPVDIYSASFWVVAKTEKTVTWVEIQNSKEDIQLTGIAHVSVFSGKKVPRLRAIQIRSRHPSDGSAATWPLQQRRWRAA